MALVRATVRWCKARFFTGTLLLILCVTAWFAISASYNSLNGSPGANSAHDGPVEQSRLTGADGEPRGRGYKSNKDNKGYDDDDEDVQFCSYPLRMESGSPATSDVWDKDAKFETCDQHSENPFYFSNGVVLLTHKRVEQLDRCEYRGIQWKSDAEYIYRDTHVIRRPASFEFAIDHDFVHVQCYLNRQGSQRSGSAVDKTDIRQNAQRGLDLMQTEGKYKVSRGRHRRQKENDIKKDRPGQPVRSEYQFHDAKDFHRSVIHRNVPRLVGSVGLPDLGDSLLGRRSYAASRQNEEAKHLLTAKTNQDKNSANEDVEKEQEVNQNQDSQDHGDIDYRQTHPEKEEEQDQSEFDQNEVEADSRPDFDQFLVQVAERKEVKERWASQTIDAVKSSLQMNILILVLDSISHASFKTNFQRSNQYLQEELAAIAMNGYNSIGDTATAAMIPLITGFKEVEVEHIKRSGSQGRFVDLLPFVWNKFEQKQYVTLYAEDQPQLGTFQTHYYGFEELPVDHYMRPFWMAASNSQLHSRSHPNCLGSIPKHRYMFDYIGDFYRKYKSIPKFAFGFLSEFNKTQLIDKDLHSFIKSLKKEGHLENTLLIILGDHGQSYGDLRHTISGKIEESLPYLSLAFPAQFRKDYGQLIANLQENRNRLTTAFDVHATLTSLLDINSTMFPVNATSRAVSLLQKIPRQRTCSTASLDMHWCTCVKYERINAEQDGNGKDGRSLASIAVDHINEHLAKENRCARLSLQDVQDVRLLFPNEKVLEGENNLDAGRIEVFNFSRRFPFFVRYHRVVFKTSPNDGVFDATIDSASLPYVVNGPISRINEYGRQSDCIIKTHPDLRKYCQCLPTVV